MKLSGAIKHIRDELAMSQKGFADAVGVSRLTVTNWENDNSIPNRIAQEKIFDIAKKNGIDIFGYMVKDMPEYKAENKKVILYHGSRSGIEGDIKPISRDRCDFGKGFYMGTQAHQPLTLIYSSDKASLYVVELDLTGLKVLHVPTSLDWAILVAFSWGKMEICKGTALYGKYKKMLTGYDIIAGKIADDRMFYVLDRFFKGDITDMGLVESLSALQLGEQYVAISEKACEQIRIIEKQNISELERLCIREVSEKNRKYGIETANDICRNYRREGRFFDEILKDGE